MQCDDLKDQLCDWSTDEPHFEMSQVHIVMWEKQNEKMGNYLYESFITHLVQSISNNS